MYPTRFTGIRADRPRRKLAGLDDRAMEAAVEVMTAQLREVLASSSALLAEAEIAGDELRELLKKVLHWDTDGWCDGLPRDLVRDIRTALEKK
jgi:hypothetical protein